MLVWLYSSLFLPPLYSTSQTLCTHKQKNWTELECVESSFVPVSNVQGARCSAAYLSLLRHHSCSNPATMGSCRRCAPAFDACAIVRGACVCVLAFPSARYQCLLCGVGRCADIDLQSTVPRRRDGREGAKHNEIAGCQVDIACCAYISTYSRFRTRVIVSDWRLR